MKSWKASFLSLAGLVLMSTQMMGFAQPKHSNEVLKDKIVKLIDQPDLSELAGDSFVAEIEFIITRRNEILVVGVNSENAFFDSYIKSQLNYSRIRIRGVQHMTPYRLQVTFHRPDPDDLAGSMAVVAWR